MTGTAAFCCGVDTHCLAVIWANGGKEQKHDALCLSLLAWQAFGWHICSMLNGPTHIWKRFGMQAEVQYILSAYVTRNMLKFLLRQVERDEHSKC